MAVIKSKSGQPSEHPSEKNIGFLVLLLLICTFIPAYTRIYDGYLQKKLLYDQKVMEEMQLSKEVNYLKKQNIAMQRRQEELKTLQGVETIARDKLGLIKPNEIPFIVNDESATIGASYFKKSRVN